MQIKCVWLQRCIFDIHINIYLSGLESRFHHHRNVCPLPVAVQENLHELKLHLSHQRGKNLHELQFNTIYLCNFSKVQTLASLVINVLKINITNCLLH